MKSFKKLIFISPFFVPVNAIAQMASSSFFSEMKSINPAVINTRSYGQYSAQYSADSIEKYQVIDEYYKEIGTADIDIKSTSVFRGGKGGGLLTTELNYLNSKGDRTEKDSSPTTTDTIISNSAKFSHYELGIGILNKLGLSIAKQDYSYRSSFEFTLDSNNFKEDTSEKIDTTIIKIGSVIPMGNFRISGYYARASITKDVKEFDALTGYDVYTKKESDQIIGGGLGYVTSASHYELSYERALSGSSSRLSLTAEIRFWKLALGYTGVAYMKGFQDNDKLVYNEIVYPDDSGATRLEHIFNFAYGASGGFSVGGSASFSKYTTKEKSPFVSDTLPAIDVDIKSMSYALKVGYVY